MAPTATAAKIARAGMAIGTKRRIA
jgi:hypothetical protein